MEHERYERDESAGERFDRNWEDVLQELRVVQTGVQLLSGFLLTLPFSDQFGRLDVWQVRLYLAIVLVSSLAVGTTLVPIGVHRRVFRHHVKDQVVATGHVLSQVVIALLACIIVGITTLIFSVVLGWEPALATGTLSAAALVVMLVVVPAAIARRHKDS